jgi:hypothetical protein
MPAFFASRRLRRDFGRGAPACVVAGCSVPALIALATYTLGKAGDY